MVAAAATTNSIDDGDNANLDRLRQMLQLLVPISLLLTATGLRSDAASRSLLSVTPHLSVSLSRCSVATCISPCPMPLHLSMSDAAASLGVHSPGLGDIVRR
jgi:hypothetical protein